MTPRSEGLTIGWISFHDEELLAASVRSVGDVRAKKVVLLNESLKARRLALDDVSILRVPHSLNLASAFNTLIAAVTTRYLLLLDTDMTVVSDSGAVSKAATYWPDSVAAKMVRQRSPSGERLSPAPAIPRPLRRKGKVSTLVETFPLGGTYYDVDLIEQCGGLNPSLEWGDHDLDLAIRLHARGYCVTLENAVEVVHDIASALKPRSTGRTYRSLCSRQALYRLYSVSGANPALPRLARHLARAALRRNWSPSWARELVETACATVTSHRTYLAPIGDEG